MQMVPPHSCKHIHTHTHTHTHWIRHKKCLCSTFLWCFFLQNI